MKLRLFYLLFLSLNIPTIIWAQSASEKYLAFDQNSFIEVTRNEVLITSFNNSFSDTLKVDNDFDYNTVCLVKSNEKPFIVSTEGGMIWSVDKTGLRRIDNSYNHKLTYGSNVFVHQDTIFKFGGYGYWSNRNFLTYFSTVTKEWEFYPVNPDTYLPPAVSRARGVYSDGQFYFDGGLTVDNHNGVSKYDSKHVWRFDFSSKSWTDLGVTNFESPRFSESVDIGHGQILVRKGKIQSTGDSFVLDYVNNTISTIDPIPNYFAIQNQLIANDSLYNNRQGVLIGVGLSELTTNMTSTKNLYLDSRTLFVNLTRVAGIVLIFIFILLIYLYMLNRNRPRLTDTGLVVNREHYSLNSKELIILNLLVFNINVNSKTIADKIRDPKLSAAQNNKIKLDLISSTDKKVSKALGISRFIHTKKSVRDKREIIYFTPNRKKFTL